MFTKKKVKTECKGVKSESKCVSTVTKDNRGCIWKKTHPMKDNSCEANGCEEYTTHHNCITKWKNS